MTAGPAERASRGRIVAAVAAIVLLALALRIAVAALSPLIALIDDIPLPAVAVGALGMLPPIGFALGSIFTPAIEQRLGLERTAITMLVIATVAMVARSLVSDTVSLLVLTALLFAAIGVANVLLPAAVKKYFPTRIGGMTAVFTMSMAVASFVPPLVAVPIAEAAGWRVSLGIWALTAAVAIIPWVRLALIARRLPDDAIEGASGALLAGVARTRLAWAMVSVFLVASAVAYTTFAWLPVILTDVAGQSSAEAGVLLAVFGVVGVIPSLLVPFLIARFGAVRLVALSQLVCGLVALGGLVLAPAVAPVLWAFLLGWVPGLFPLVLVLIGLRTRTHRAAVALAGFVQSVGYGLAALFPLIVGVLHEVTGSWVPGLVVLAVVMVAALPAIAVLARPGNVEDAWEHRGRRDAPE